MNYCIINNDNCITNIIVADESFADSIGALPAYDGAKIGDVYDYVAPDPVPEPPTEMEQLRADVDYLLMLQEG